MSEERQESSKDKERRKESKREERENISRTKETTDCLLFILKGHYIYFVLLFPIIGLL
jgi:hypothetical protein